MTDVQVTLAEIYRKMCPKCKKALRQLVTDKVSAAQVDALLKVPE